VGGHFLVHTYALLVKILDEYIEFGMNYVTVKH
jgi:hypothetical protein